MKQCFFLVSVAVAVASFVISIFFEVEVCRPHGGRGIVQGIPIFGYSVSIIGTEYGFATGYAVSQAEHLMEVPIAVAGRGIHCRYCELAMFKRKISVEAREDIALPFAVAHVNQHVAPLASVHHQPELIGADKWERNDGVEVLWSVVFKLQREADAREVEVANQAVVVGLARLVKVLDEDEHAVVVVVVIT